MKEYVLKVQELWDPYGGDLLGYYTKGHHDAAAFIEIANSRDRAEGGDGDWAECDVAHRWWRTVQAPAGTEVDYLFQAVSGPGRGVYPVTVVYI